MAVEVNFDGLVGPTHNYAGLAHGNLAAARSKDTISNPREAALQGLEKMWFLHKLGVPQAVLPPRARPRFDVLQKLGYSGSEPQMLEKAFKESRETLAAVYSSSFMWAANAATVCPSSDSIDGKCHLLPANLVSNFHRSIEADETHRLLNSVFCDDRHFKVHYALPAQAEFADEGAANHNRLHHNGQGLHIFCYGASAAKRFKSRQTYEASASVARAFQLKNAPVFIEQSAAAVDAGAFHNDVVCVMHENIVLKHAEAFADKGYDQIISRLFEEVTGEALNIINVDNVSLPEAVDSYLFNSQLVTTDDGILLVLPLEASEVSAVSAAVQHIVDSNNAISSTKFFDLRQSMRNGGGPACLRLRVCLQPEELNSISKYMLTEELYSALRKLITENYRDRLTASDLVDYSFAHEALEVNVEVEKLFNF